MNTLQSIFIAKIGSGLEWNGHWDWGQFYSWLALEKPLKFSEFQIPQLWRMGKTISPAFLSTILWGSKKKKVWLCFGVIQKWAPIVYYPYICSELHRHLPYSKEEMGKVWRHIKNEEDKMRFSCFLTRFFSVSQFLHLPHFQNIHHERVFFLSLKMTVRVLPRIRCYEGILGHQMLWRYKMKASDIVWVLMYVRERTP